MQPAFETKKSSTTFYFERNMNFVHFSIPLLLVFLLSLASCGCSGDSGGGDEDLVDIETSSERDLEELQDEEDEDEDSEELVDALDDLDESDIADADLAEADSDGADIEPELSCEPSCGDNSQCVAGSCQCQEGFGDCDLDASNGCEADLSSPEFCGSCAVQCGDHGLCNAGFCECQEGFADCDGELSNGCEADLESTLHCGSCGHDCGANTECASAACACTANHFDIDQDLGQPGSNGCEFALLPQTNSDLAGELGGTILDLELDGQKLFVLYEDGTQHIAAYDLQDPTQLTLLNTVDVNSNVGTEASLAAQNNVVALTSNDLLVTFYVHDGEFSKVQDALFNGVLAVEALDQAQMPDALAGFLAYGPGVTRYAVFATGDEPTGFSCFGSSTHEVCTTSVSSNPAGAHLATMGQLAGKAWTLVLGEAAFREFKLDALGQAIAPIISGDAVDLELDLAMAWSDGFIGAKGAELLHYTYSYTVTNDPETRTQSSLGSLAAAATAWALLGGDILAYAHSGGLSLHALDTTSEHELSANPVDELEAEAGLLVSRSGGSVRVYSYE